MHTSEAKEVLVSVVMPAHNEEHGIEVAIRTVRRILDEAALKNEIIIVDDGSSDNMFHRIELISGQLENVTGIQLSRNFGKEAAILAGLRAARGDVVVTMDSDLQHPPTLIPQMVEAWRSGAKVVNAVKRDRKIDTLAVRIRALVYGWLSKLIGGLDLRNSSDFKLLDREVVDVINNLLTERERLYRGLVQWVGFEQKEILFDVDERITGASKFSYKALCSLAITGAISYTVMPLRIITILGVLTLILGFGVIVEALWSLYHGTAVSGFMTMISVLLIVGSFIMISLGILGEYVAKIYKEIKQRPAYIVALQTGLQKPLIEGKADENTCPQNLRG